ncbi:MAG: alpha/beta fold hydrolase, partial [Bacteroidetes bacterium]|nr:alpha/beta fold hydrolase [Bacteroidota bacterium]
GRSRGNWRLPRAKLLAERGIAALVYDKRGVGDSEGDWDTATVHDLAGDAAAALATVAAHPDVDAERVGLYGSSAGGWVAPRAYVLSDVPPAFVITRVGPATSVEEQQLDVVGYLADQADLDAAERARFNEFIRVENDLSLSDEAVYERLTALLDDERNADWADFLADAAPASPEDVPGLWVRRHAYDPADALRQIDVPFLAIYGEDDYVVPPDENVPLLRQLLDEAGNTDYRILVLPEAGHGLEHGHRLRTLDDGGMKRYYFKYDRVAPGAYQAIVDFLNETMLSSDTSP